MSKIFDFQKTPLKGLFKVDRKLNQDDRGIFSRFFCVNEFKEIGLSKHIEQINYSMTKKKGTVRGMHFQYPPFSETKIVSCIEGEVFDVAIDLRVNSPTLFQWHSEILSSSSQSALFIPEGFAHGFQALTNNCKLLYLVTSPYAPNSEGGVSALDPKLSINWPFEIVNMSAKDSTQPFLDEQFKGIKF